MCSCAMREYNIQKRKSIAHRSFICRNRISAGVQIEHDSSSLGGLILFERAYPYLLIEYCLCAIWTFYDFYFYLFFLPLSCPYHFITIKLLIPRIYFTFVFVFPFFFILAFVLFLFRST